MFSTKRALQKADIILSVSDNTKKDILKYYPFVDKNKTFVTHL
jgi:hypothetical protein